MLLVDEVSLYASRGGPCGHRPCGPKPSGGLPRPAVEAGGADMPFLACLRLAGERRIHADKNRRRVCAAHDVACRSAGTLACVRSMVSKATAQAGVPVPLGVASLSSPKGARARISLRNRRHVCVTRDVACRSAGTLACVRSMVSKATAQAGVPVLLGVASLSSPKGARARILLRNRRHVCVTRDVACRSAGTLACARSMVS